jgi:hypothetical protein
MSELKATYRRVTVMENCEMAANGRFDAAIDKAAADDERSVASYIEGVVSEHLRKKGYLKYLSRGPHPHTTAVWSMAP